VTKSGHLELQEGRWRIRVVQMAQQQALKQGSVVKGGYVFKRRNVVKGRLVTGPNPN
jgi:hypothetical protein